MKRLIALMTALALVFLPGCGSAGTVYSNYREVEQMLLIRTLGFDGGDNPLTLSVCGGEPTSENGVTRMSASSQSITACMNRIQDYTDWEELFYAHTQYLLVGQDRAAAGLSGILDYVESSQQLHTDTPLFVVRTGTAEELVLHCGGEKSDITQALDSLVRDSEKLGDGHTFTCGEIIASNAENGAALAPAVEAVPMTDVDPSAKEDQLTPLPAGYAILKDNTLAGFLSQTDARGINLLLGEIGSGAFSIKSGTQTFSLVLSKGNVKLSPVWGEDGALTGIRADIKASAFVEETDPSGPPDRAELTKSLETELEQWVLHVLQAMADTEADFLGIGNRLRMQDPKKWDAMPKAWAEVIGDLTFDVQAECEIVRTDELRG